MSFPPGTEMFQFPGFASATYVFSCRYPIGVGCPIRISTDQRLLAAPRGFSQRATSFIASWCQGIHRMPFSRSRSYQSIQRIDLDRLTRRPTGPTTHRSHPHGLNMPGGILFRANTPNAAGFELSNTHRGPLAASSTAANPHTPLNTCATPVRQPGFLPLTGQT